MKCQEVIELMQRDLDRDLLESEHEELQLHIQGCDDCQETYRKLTLLSSELENLPKVTPSLSIVDSIMPALDRIDRELAAESAAQSNAREITGPENRMNPRSYWRKKNWRIISGVVAAGIAFGLIFANMELGQSSSDQANSSPSSGSSMNQNASASSAPSSANTSSSAQESIMMDSGASHKATSSELPKANQNKQGVMGIQGSEPQALEAPMNTAPPEAADRPHSEVNENQIYGFAAPTQSTEPAEAADTSEPNTLQSIESVPQVDDQQGEPMYSIAGQAEHSDHGGEQEMIPSPDSSYAAYIEGQTVVVVDASGTVWYQTENYNTDRFVNMHWSNDGMTLYYETVIEDSLIGYELDVQNKTVTPAQQ